MVPTDLLTIIRFDDKVERYRELARTNPDGVKAAVHFSTDMFGIPEVTVYRDDGNGNGTIIFRFPLI